MVQTDDLVPQLVIANPGSEPVIIDVDAFEFFSSDLQIVTAEVAPGTQLRVSLPDNDGQPYGIRVSAAGPVTAVVVAESPADPPESGEALPDPTADVEPVVVRIAGTVGIEAPSNGWLLPGAGAVPSALSTTIWLMNTGETAATVTLKPLGVREMTAEKVAVPAGRVVAFEIPDDTAIASYLVESTAPVTAAWSSSDGAGTVFVAGVAIDD